MSDEDGEDGTHDTHGPQVIFYCHYGSKFEQDSYGDGLSRVVECKAEELFTELMNQLPISLYGQGVWYKLPFEEIAERKKLHNGDENFRKMCEAAMWTKVVDIFVCPIDDNEDEEVEGRLGAEGRVERIVSDFVDEEVNEYDTPPGSESEDDDKVNYLRYKKGSGELKLKQTFNSLTEFKEAVVDYVLKEGWNVQYVRWEKDKSELKCASEGKDACQWKIYCSYEAPLQKWMVKVYNNEHSCIKSGFCKILNQEVIAKLFVNDLRENPNFMPKDIQAEIEKRWSLIASIDKCRKAKKRALEIIQEEHDAQFSRLRDYRLELLDSNQGSTVELETITGDEGVDVFFRFYVCFAALKKTWSSFCRPIFGLDGCFLKCTTRDQLLAAVGRDANNQMFPIAWAIVDVENEPNWKWFIQRLQTDLDLGDGDGFTVISDRQKGLINAVTQLLPNVEHRMCARHIYANLKKKHPHKADMKGLFWKLAKSYNTAQYNKRLDEVKNYDINVYESIMEKNPKNCSLAYCKPTSSCDDVSNNISEAFNHAIDPARSMPLVEMLEIIRRRAMLRIEARKTKATKHKGTFSPTALLKLQLEQKKIMYCKAFPSGGSVYEVKENKSAFKVYMDTHSCTCRRWDMSGVPCRHALKIIADKKLNPEDYISDWFLTSRWRNEYSSPILPVRGMDFWEKFGDAGILPPPRETQRGRKPIRKRIKGKNESPQKKNRKERHESPTKVTRERRIIHCGRCGGVGHNTRKCVNVGAEVSRPPKKKGKVPQDGAEFVEGQSQPSQSQVID